MTIFPFLKRTISDYSEHLEWLIILCYYATEIPMYQITVILHMHFQKRFNPLKSREIYKTMEQTGAEPFCKIVEREFDDPYVKSVLDAAREYWKRII